MDKDQNTFINVFPDSGRGLRLSVKDLFHVKGKLTTGGAIPMLKHRSVIGSELLKGFEPYWTIIGKDNCDEFGVGSSGFSSVQGQVRYGGLKIGGSSTGTALNVFLDRASLGIGTDTGGSIRDVTHSLKRVWGYKPTYGLLSRSGLIPHSNLLDTPSLLSKSVSLLVLGLRLGMRYRNEDSTLIKKGWVYPSYRSILYLRNGFWKNLSNGRKQYTSRNLKPSTIYRCYLYWSSVYLYSNLNKFNNKLFTDDGGEEWIFRPNLRRFESRWSESIRKRRLWGFCYLKIRSERGEKLHDHMYRLRIFYRRLVNILGSRYLLLSKVRDDQVHESFENWGLVLANFASAPALSYGNWNFFGCRRSDMKLMSFFL